MPDRTDPAQLETLLQSRTRFRRLVFRPSCESTQALATADFVDAGDAVFWADHQTAGRGRQQRHWHDEPGLDLCATFRVREPLPEPLALPAALPVAVLQACEPFAGRRLRIKWPNDLFVDGRKLCGVLIDRGSRDPHSYLFGVGIYVNRTRFPRDLEPTATSLALVAGRETDRGRLLLAVSERIDAMVTDIAARRLADLEAAFRDRIGLLGQRVLVDAGDVHEGELTAIDFQRLVLDGRRAVPLAVVRGLRSG
jgi:BirA family biotin operon repressor/biotin-[acetyl-CoA-carboxylase] ligase